MSKQYGNEDFLANLIAQACGGSAVQTSGTKLEMSPVLKLKTSQVILYC